jgi:hypothetical protein
MMREGEDMAEHIPFFQLRVLGEFDEKYKTFVAYCLETGSVVTAEDPKSLKEEMKELLEDELSFAFETKNLANLFSSPAPFDKWTKWQEISEKVKPDIIELFFEKSGRKGQQSSEVKLAQAAAA